MKGIEQLGEDIPSQEEKFNETVISTDESLQEIKSFLEAGSYSYARESLDALLDNLCDYPGLGWLSGFMIHHAIPSVDSRGAGEAKEMLEAVKKGKKPEDPAVLYVLTELGGVSLIRFPSAEQASITHHFFSQLKEMVDLNAVLEKQGFFAKNEPANSAFGKSFSDLSYLLNKNKIFEYATDVEGRE